MQLTGTSSGWVKQKVDIDAEVLALAEIGRFCSAAGTACAGQTLHARNTANLVKRAKMPAQIRHHMRPSA